MLEQFVTEHREEIIRRCRAKVMTRVDPVPTDAEVNHGVPMFLDQLVDTLRSQLPSNAAIGVAAMLHARDMLAREFTVSQVVHNYGDICQSITEIAVEGADKISADDFHTLNRCLDDAIANAVTEFERGSHVRMTSPSRSQVFHEMRGFNEGALNALDAIQTGSIGVSGSTAAVLRHSLVGMRALIDHALDPDASTVGRA